MPPLRFKTQLQLPPLLDFTKKNDDIGYVKILLNKSFSPAPDCFPSGDDISLPIFSSEYHLGSDSDSDSDKKIHHTTFGLPFFKFKRGRPANIKFENNTGYSFNLHWHGLNTPADIDGA